MNLHHEAVNLYLRFLHPLHLEKLKLYRFSFLTFSDHAILKTLKDFLVLSDSNNNNNDENGDESLDDAEVYKTLDSHRRFESLDARVYGTRVIGKKEIR